MVLGEVGDGLGRGTHLHQGIVGGGLPLLEQTLGQPQRVRRLFALTTRAQHWFVEQGFRQAAISSLPQRRQALYNWKRGSKVFVKRI